MQQLEQQKALNLLARYSIPYCKTQVLAMNEVLASRPSYPVVLKTAAREVVHKSDIGAVVTDISSDEQLRYAAQAISGNVRAHYPNAQDIFLLQEQLQGTELIIGMKRDPQFGPVLMFGLGGIFVEVFKDVSFRIAPVDKREALAMISEIKAISILKGARGSRPVNLESVADLIMKVSKLSMQNAYITELDLNPVIANEASAKVADVRMMGE